MFPSFCLLQDIQTKAIIGRGTKRGGLYYVDDMAMGHVHQVRDTQSEKRKKIWLWHKRLRHASFDYLKYLLPSLFDGVKLSDFTCESCILAKVIVFSYFPSLNKRDTLFALIHSDVWGPSPIVTPSGIRWFVLFVNDCTQMI